MCDMTGYEPKTTFWQDFTIAEPFGGKEIRETFSRVFQEWQSDVVYLTELVMVLNWKLWSWYEYNESIAEIYHELYEKADMYALDNLQGDELHYFLNTVD